MTRRANAIVWGVVGVLAVGVIWELYKFLGPAEGVTVGAVTGAGRRGARSAAPHGESRPRGGQRATHSS